MGGGTESAAATSSRRRPRTWQFPQQRGSPRNNAAAHGSAGTEACTWRRAKVSFLQPGAGDGDGAEAGAGVGAGAGAGVGAGAGAGVGAGVRGGQ